LVELSSEENHTKVLEIKQLLAKLQYESDIKTSLIEVLLKKVDALEKQERSTNASELNKSDDKCYGTSGSSSIEAQSDDEVGTNYCNSRSEPNLTFTKSQKSDEPSHNNIDDYVSNSAYGHRINGHLSLPVSPLKIDRKHNKEILPKNIAKIYFFLLTLC